MVLNSRAARMVGVCGSNDSAAHSMRHMNVVSIFLIVICSFVDGGYAIDKVRF
jgi:hypothetical protein